MKKPDLAEPTSPEFLGRVKLILQIVTGRRNNKITLASVTSADAVGATPTQAEYNALRADLIETRTKLAALIARFDE